MIQEQGRVQQRVEQMKKIATEKGQGEEERKGVGRWDGKDIHGWRVKEQWIENVLVVLFSHSKESGEEEGGRKGSNSHGCRARLMQKQYVLPDSR